VTSVLSPGRSSDESVVAGLQVANYFEQNQADALDLDLTVEETIVKASTTETYNELRSLMAQFLFKGDACKKTVSCGIIRRPRIDLYSFD
jgi:ATPase subunit of ABC transporter with duplicated ATPase domains